MAPEIDLRSDTVTKPCQRMRSAMMHAEVGDDVICHDPTVEALQEEVAQLLGKEAAVFMPSGSMTNQVALRVHCQPGDEFLCEAECHIYNYEQGAFAQLSGLIPQTLPGEYGILDPKQLEGRIRSQDDHAVRTSLVTLENTHNRGGGSIQPLKVVDEICAWAKQHGLSTHLDGARLFNAVAATEVEASRWSAGFDSVSVCFSKGLGAPIGSALAGTSDFVAKARRTRKLFGGGMRQVGILAAAAQYALRENRERLSEDHAKAKQLADAARTIDGLAPDPEPQTNIVLIHVDPNLGSSADFVTDLAALEVGAFPFGPQHVRFVTHKDVSQPQLDRACEILEQVAAGRIARAN